MPTSFLSHPEHGDLLSHQQTASALGISDRTLHLWVAKGKTSLKSVRVRGLSNNFYKRAEVEAVLTGF